MSLEHRKPRDLAAWEETGDRGARLGSPDAGLGCVVNKGRSSGGIGTKAWEAPERRLQSGQIFPGFTAQADFPFRLRLNHPFKLGLPSRLGPSFSRHCSGLRSGLYEALARSPVDSTANIYIVHK